MYVCVGMPSSFCPGNAESHEAEKKLGYDVCTSGTRPRFQFATVCYRSDQSESPNPLDITV